VRGGVREDAGTLRGERSGEDAGRGRAGGLLEVEEVNKMRWE